jgi:hypothetical protein
MKLKTLWITLIVTATLVGITVAGNAAKNGSGSGAGVAPLTDTQIATLLFMREEEKLARDLYLTLDDAWDAAIFANISESEQNHMDAVGQLISLYGLTDPVVDNAIGAFTDPTLGALYLQLAAQGKGSLEAALGVGVLVEQKDIEDLQKALADNPPTPVRRVYTNLLAASQQHLQAFLTCTATSQTCLGCTGTGICDGSQRRSSR